MHETLLEKLSECADLQNFDFQSSPYFMQYSVFDHLKSLIDSESQEKHTMVSVLDVIESVTKSKKIKRAAEELRKGSQLECTEIVEVAEE